MSTKIVNINGVDEYLRAIKNERRVIIVDFFATWCAPCQKLMTMLGQLIQQYESDIVVFKIDIEIDKKLPEDQRLVPIFKVTGLPSVFFVKDSMLQRSDEYRITGFDATKISTCVSTLVGKEMPIF